MKCPSCGHELSEGALFCGNCGQPIAQPSVVQPQVVQSAPIQQQPVVTAQVPPQQPVIPATTQLPPVQDTPQSGKKAVVGFILGLLGFPGSLIPIVGFIMGILAVIFGSGSLKSNRKGLATAGLVLGIIVILLSLISFGINIALDDTDYSMRSFDYKVFQSSIRFLGK